MSVLTFVLFILSFILMFIILNVKEISPYWGVVCFGIVSFAIGIQWAFRLLCNCRMYLFIPADMKATMSSVNSAVARLYGGFFFILIKVLLDGVSLRDTFIICFVFFLALSVPLKAVYSIQSKEEDNVQK